MIQPEIQPEIQPVIRPVIQPGGSGALTYEETSRFTSVLSNSLNEFVAYAVSVGAFTANKRLVYEFEKLAKSKKSEPTWSKAIKYPSQLSLEAGLGSKNTCVLLVTPPK